MGKGSLRDEIADVEERLAALRREEARLVEELDALRSRVDSTMEEHRLGTHIAEAAPTPTTSHAKIALFRSFFRGRTDVYATRWEQRKAGRSGYALACANEWTPGLCEKPRVKCGECPNQAFRPVSDATLHAHLVGDEVVGVYPLLENDTCWLLAVDFDKTSWSEDVAAFAETSQPLGLVPLVERSRSGNGAHAWFFFANPVSAMRARQMGTFLLTETMARRHELSMSSYDRLFPNQDTLPRGGYGNLIALPLQGKARKRGNTVFVDSAGGVLPDQWRALADAPRISSEMIDEIVADADHQGSIVGVRAAAVDDGEEPPPWQPPSRGRLRATLGSALPRSVRGVLAQQLYVEKAELPSPLLNEIKRIAAFQNPEFYKRQAMRLSTALTPRIVSCAADHVKYVSIPRGCIEDLRTLLSELEIGLDLDDQRQEGAEVDLAFDGQLTTIQLDAVGALLKHEYGVLVAPPGSGKTVMAIAVLAARKRSTLILTHRKPLLEQWVAQLSVFLGIEQKRVGRLGAGKARLNGVLDIAMLQSLARSEQASELVRSYGQVVVDECHHLPAVTFERVLAACPARFVTGLTATPYRRDGHQPIIEMQCGRTRFSLSPRAKDSALPFKQRLILRKTRFKTALDNGESIQRLYGEVAEDVDRNSIILDDVISALEEGRSPVLLTERRDHLEHLTNKLRPFARHVVSLHGGMKPGARREASRMLGELPDDEERLVIATGRYIGEGFDDRRLDTLFLAMPVSWKGTLVQYAGRLHRVHAGKTEVRIYDYVDEHVPVLRRMFVRRMRGYEAIGYRADKNPNPPTGEEAETSAGEAQVDLDFDLDG